MKKLIVPPYDVSILVIPANGLNNSPVDIQIADMCWKNSFRVRDRFGLICSVPGGTKRSTALRNHISIIVTITILSISSNTLGQQRLFLLIVLTHRT